MSVQKKQQQHQQQHIWNDVDHVDVCDLLAIELQWVQTTRWMWIEITNERCGAKRKQNMKSVKWNEWMNERTMENNDARQQLFRACIKLIF